MSTVNHTNMRGLIPSDQSRMIVFRRELTRSKMDVHRVALAQDASENPPTGRRTPGKTIVQNPPHTLDVSFREQLANRPDEPGQLPGTSHDGGLRRLPALDQMPVLPAKSFFGPLRDRN